MQTHMRSLRDSQRSKSNGSLNQDKTGSARAIEDQLSPRAKYKQRNPTHKGIVRNALAELHLTEFEKRRKQGGKGGEEREAKETAAEEEMEVRLAM